MYEPNLRQITASLHEDDRVLDVGGWYRPWVRADAVVDILPYATRGIGGITGAGPERFDESTWYVQDICSKPLSFPDKSFDFVMCSHTLEDVRDPVYVCSELARVASRGYIEVPSRYVESTLGLEGRSYVGHYHHRWLVETIDNSLIFRFKPHAIHEDRRYHLPRRALRGLPELARVEWMFWEGAFECREVIEVSHLKTRIELADFVNRTVPPNVLERLVMIARAPSAALHYRDLRALRHPCEARVRRDTDSDERIWRDLPAVNSDAHCLLIGDQGR